MNSKPNRGGHRPHFAIVGAGPAGASLAIRLAAAKFPVTLIERERFPRHKLCGEFISPECLLHFERLGVKQRIAEAGGCKITATAFHAMNRKSVTIPSELFGGPALSLSRARMDDILLDQARSGGVEILEGASVVGLEINDGVVRVLKVRSAGDAFEIAADIFVDATGRSRLLSKLIRREDRMLNRTPARPSLYVGYKAHLSGVDMAPNICEMHSFPGGYGGLVPVEDGLVNHCFIVTAAKAREMKGSAERLLDEAVFRNERARRSLAGATPVGAWLTVSVDGYGFCEPANTQNVFSIGDSAAFIDPFTGSGMLMALESAQIFADCVAKSECQLSRLTADYAASHRRSFARRLRVSSLIRRSAFVPWVASFAVTAMRRSSKVREWVARSTRPTGIAQKTLP
ncbi:NAD(P)/FAD-dependent oxidoreductase [soil metagenome]